MTPEEIGTLVLRIQDDDVRPSDLRKFLMAITEDAEVRRNASLAGKLSGLPLETRSKHCVANVMFLLSHDALAPAGEAAFGWQDTTPFFSERFFFVLTGPWKHHLQVDGALPTAADISKAGRRARAKKAIPLKVSRYLAGLLRTLEEFWDTDRLLLP